jgi:ribosomal protein S18 acetylase RimI-like enzyme
VIRPAGPQDAEALAGLQVRAWWRAYADYVDPERFGTVEERAARWREHLAPGARETLVFDQDGVVAGFASLGPARDAGLPPGTGELMAVYVDPPAQGAGVGGALLTAAEARLEALGYAEAVLSVFARNDHARHVYERRGWTLDPGGEHDDLWAPAVRYRRALGTSSA